MDTRILIRLKVSALKNRFKVRNFHLKVIQHNVAVHTVNRNILSPKFTTLIGTFNTRTLIDKNKRSELAHLFEMRGVHILSIQEHKFKKYFFLLE